MAVALLQLSDLGVAALHLAERDTVLVERGLHRHHDVPELGSVHVAAGRPAESIATHGGTDHLYGCVCRTLERRTATQLDDVGTTLGDTYLQIGPRFIGQLVGTDQVGQRCTIHLCSRGKYGHLLAMAAIGAGTGHLALIHTEMFCQLALQTGAVECGQGSHL